MQDSKTSPSIHLPDNLTLGKSVSYESTYTPSLLQGVPRALGRDAIHLPDDLPFHGTDVWTGYELSWLNSKGKPCVAIVECAVPVTSPNLIESKSFKLYLNSFNQTRFDSTQDVEATLTRDLSQCAGETVDVTIIEPPAFNSLVMEELSGKVIDELDIEVDTYQPTENLLKTGNDHVEETLVSHLLKSNCLITSQPDWASVQIRYSGQNIDHESLLRFLISFRQHNEFHEQCVERIFNDILTQCQPEKLTVYARYTRRGGLDINPFRSNFEQLNNNHRHARQ